MLCLRSIVQILVKTTHQRQFLLTVKKTLSFLVKAKNGKSKHKSTRFVTNKSFRIFKTDAIHFNKLLTNRGTSDRLTEKVLPIIAAKQKKLSLKTKSNILNTFSNNK